MANVITLSDSSSDESDDLPSFADRVKQLIKTKEVNRVSSPEKKLSLFHTISDSDDSTDTIPFSRNRSPSPVCSLPELEYDSATKCDNLNVDDVIPNFNHRSVSPVYSLPELPCDSNSEYDNLNLDDGIPNFNHRSVSPVSNINIRKLHSNQKEYNLSSDDDSFFLKGKNRSPSYTDSNIPVYKSNLSDEDASSDVFLKKKVKQKGNVEKIINQDAEKEMRKKMKLEKQKEKELLKALKDSEKEILNNKKPEECLKNIKIVLDHNILYLEGSQSALNLLDEKDIKYSVEENICKHTVNWYRKVINISTENHEIVKQEREELADTLVMIIPNDEFLKMLHAYTQKAKGRSSDHLSLAEYIVNVKSLYSDCNITCTAIGFQKYMRKIKEDGSFDLKTIAKQVHKNASEEAVIELQLQSPVNFRYLDDMNEFGNLLQQFTKAIAEAPQRKEKQIQQKSLAFSWYADIDSHCPIKLSKDRACFIKLWQQQIQQFQNVGPEVAEAIASRYPSPRLLLKAYKKCATTKDAENLLQDIVVRRNYGPLGTQKRIGPELSFKLYLFFTSRDGDKLLKR